MSRTAVLVVIGIIEIVSSASRKTNAPPSVHVTTDQPVYFISGELVVLNCAVTGQPKPQVSWLKEGVPFAFSTQSSTTHPITTSESGSLTFHSIRKEDQGKYQCSATNVYGVSLSTEIVVKEAFIENLLDEEDIRIVAPLGHARTLACVPPYSQPKGKVIWTKMRNDGSELMLDNNLMGNDLEISQRMTPDYEGRLHILSTRPEDSDGWFACTVTNEFLQSTVTGRKHMLSFTGEYPVLRPTELLWKSPRDVLAVMYEIVKLKCIMGGNPVPRVTWTHNGVEISSSGGYEISDNTFELTILEFQDTEVGRYQCTGNNEIGDDVVETFDVSAVQKPFWISEPKDVAVFVHDDVTLRCEARGIPDPYVSWFVNGIPIEESDVLYENAEFLDESLVLKNLQISDSAVYQCNASNPYGFIWADFYLHVQAVLPLFEGNSDLVVKALRGGSLLLPCQPVGHPEPNKIWYKNDKIIKPNKQFHITTDGDLRLENVKVQDGGSYSCVASNKFGSDKLNINVTIQEMTRIIVPPVSKVVTSGDDVSFHCEAVTDYREQASLNVTWMKNNKTIDTRSKQYRGRLAITHDALVLRDVAVGDRGLYACVATSSIDTATATARLKVKGPPDAPFDIWIIHCTPGRADIGWKFNKSLENFSQVRNFSVQYRTHHRPGKWVLAAEAPHHRRQAAMRLVPWTKYTFRVAAVSDLGRGSYSAPSEEKCSTPMSRPFRNPRRIRKIANKTGFLVLEWAPIPKDEHNGYGFYYNVTVKEDGTKTYSSYIIEDYNVTRIEIPVGTVFRPYSIMVSAGNMLGQSLKAPRVTKGYSGEAVPLAVPENFKLDPSYPVTDTSARVQWDRVNSSLAAIRGAFKGYQLTYWKTEDPENKKGIRIPPNRSKPKKLRHTLNDLPPYTNISMDIAVLNAYFISNHSNVINFTTLEGVPGKVQYLFIQSRGSRYFLLEWKEPENPNGELLGYQIGYKKQPFTNAMTVALTFDTPNISRAFLSGLEPETLYKVAISGYSRQGFGEVYYMTALTLEDSLPLAEPRVTKVVAGRRSVTVQWELDESVDARAASTYYIKYRRVGNGKWQQVEEEKATDFTHEITDLEPRSTYYVVVIGQDEAGNSVSSKQSTIGTMPEEVKVTAGKSSVEMPGSGNGTMMDYDFDDYDEYEPDVADKTTETFTNLTSHGLTTAESLSSNEEDNTTALLSPSNEHVEKIPESPTSTESMKTPESPTLTETMTTGVGINTTEKASDVAVSTKITKSTDKEMMYTKPTTSKGLIKATVGHDLSAGFVKQNYTTAASGVVRMNFSTTETTITTTAATATTTTAATTTTTTAATTTILKTTRAAPTSNNRQVHLVTKEVFTVTLKPNGRPDHRTPLLKGEESVTVSITTGEALDLVCNIDGSPAPSVTWLRNDVPVVSGHGAIVIGHGGIPDSRLIVLRTDDASAGLFKCVAENYLGLAEQRFWVLLKEAPCPVAGSRSVVWMSSATWLLLCVLSSALV